MEPQIINVEANGDLIGWRVFIDGTIVDVKCFDLPVPNYPTIHQIIHVARVALSPVPKAPCKLKKTRVKNDSWSSAHSHCQAIAKRDQLDIDLIVEALPGALESLTYEYEAREHAKRTAHEITGLTVKNVNDLGDRDLDYSTIPHFDEHAMEMAYSHPELNWDPSNANSEGLWALLHEKLLRKPTRFAAETIERAAELATRNNRRPMEFAPLKFGCRVNRKAIAAELASVPF